MTHNRANAGFVNKTRFIARVSEQLEDELLLKRADCRVCGQARTFEGKTATQKALEWEQRHIAGNHRWN